ncbi:Metallo-dependent phosphatase [Aspergillus heteromorphus CBS 117.55]|uniref:Metallo-dependent phosphatase n=1 Tax=Aspergillus heteromorphus CBS 117.55 TaxID=1448321 RepID=A0A317WZZ0_9EURO|nr:Metallo-dependent phosphatase [Aspergillus heteromorphus CBS 117.55]PWY90892.1 Metallo-dependent phosphatase [Aspergillus heteromorphus CBS 117.55]
MSNPSTTTSSTLDYSSDTSDPPLFPPSHHHNPRLNRYTRPLISYVRNEWQLSNSKYSQLPTTTGNNTNTADSSLNYYLQMILSIITAPRFRRYAIVYLSLVLGCLVGWEYFLAPRMEEHAELVKALDPDVGESVGGWFGVNALPRLEGVVLLGELAGELVPGASGSGTGSGSGKNDGKEKTGTGRRLVVVGDVHGCSSELEHLLTEVTFTPSTDHLILAGDLINKGPDSTGVVDLARKYSASCVRGNHEDRVLVLRRDMIDADTLTDTSADAFLDGQSTEQAKRDRTLARKLSDEQAEWLDACPVILDVGQVPNMGRVAVVHGGLVPGVELEKQDPFSVMNMLSIDLETHLPSSERGEGIKWTKLFNKHQSVTYSNLKSTSTEVARAQTTTVIYGHDSKTGLNIKTYTKGLDSGCVKGGKLTALVISDDGEQELVQVRCNNYLDS